MPIALADLLLPQRIELNLQATDRAAAIRELAGLLARDGAVADAEALTRRVLDREQDNTTLVENGVAFPHARTDALEELVLATGRSVEGVSWGGPDERAHLIFLVGVPRKLLNDYLVVIGGIARAVKDDALRTLLVHAENVDDFIATLLSAP
jgi:PTS system fructose-specific IIC component